MEEEKQTPDVTTKVAQAVSTKTKVLLGLVMGFAIVGMFGIAFTGAKDLKEVVKKDGYRDPSGPPIFQCSDGTPHGYCASSTPPLYCEEGNLINNCEECGCPIGLTCLESYGNCTTTSALLGDVDGNYNIDSYDASLIMQYATDSLDLEDWQMVNANVNCDDYVGAYDAALILQYATGVIDEFPCEGLGSMCLHEGNYYTDFSYCENNDPCDSNVDPVYSSDGLVCNGICVVDGSMSNDSACCADDNCYSGDCTDNVCVSAGLVCGNGVIEGDEECECGLGIWDGSSEPCYNCYVGSTFCFDEFLDTCSNCVINNFNGPI